MRSHTPKPLALLFRGADLRALFKFLASFEELATVAVSDANRQEPADHRDRPGVLARGCVRRRKLHTAFVRAAKSAGFEVDFIENRNGTWTTPVVTSGAFRLTIGIADYVSKGRRRLRSRGRYVRDLVARNGAVDPQGSLFKSPVRQLIPNGSLGGFLSIETRASQPDVPQYIGLLVPSPNLKANNFGIPLRHLLAYIREEIAGTKKPERKAPKRILPKAKRKPKSPPDA